MPKRIIFIFVVLCSLSALSCCGRTEVTPEETLEELYSVSDALLNKHYGVTISQTEGYAQFLYDIEHISPPPASDAYNLDERLEALIKQKYQGQPLTDKGLESVRLLPLNPVTLWKKVLSTGSDIEVTSVKTSLRNTDINDEKNDIDYSIDLLIDKASYKVTGALILVLVDNKWMIDGIREFNWSPSFPY